jgi:hypothetical protein
MRSNAGARKSDIFLPIPPSSNLKDENYNSSELPN